MENPALICDECGILLDVPGTIATPVDVNIACRLTAEEKYNLDIVCPSDTCPSRFIPKESFRIMESVHMEQSGDVQTVGPRENMGGQQPQLSNNDLQQQKQQEEDEDFEKTLQLELELFLNDPLQEIDGKLVHQGQNPCRGCYQRGLHCVKLPGSEICTSCQPHRKCHRSLVGAKPVGLWSKKIVLDYSAPLFINASRVWEGPDGGDMLEYRVKYPFRFGRTRWVAAEDLREYTWILKKFHHDMPSMPGPPNWLVEEEDDEFFYGDSDHLPM